MAYINLTVDDLIHLSNMMMKWREELHILNERLRSQVRTMEGWRDPQFIMFLHAIEMASNHMETYMMNMEQMGKSLKMYANQQKEANSSFRSFMGNFNNY